MKGGGSTAIDTIRKIVIEESPKELWTLRDFQEMYHPEIKYPTTLSNNPEDRKALSDYYFEVAIHYAREVQGLIL